MRRLAFLVLAALALPAAGAPAGTEITWYGHAAFVVKTPAGTVIATIDPWLSNPLARDKEAVQKLGKVDYVLVTHGHFDHVGDAVAIGKATGAKLVTNFELANALAAAGFPKEQATLMTAGNIGGTFALGGDVTVTIVAALHSSTFRKDEASPVEPTGNPLGFVLHVKGGPTIYHTGDTDVTSDMKILGERHKVDVMLACIGGHFTMDPAGAALAASYVQPRAIVPMHFGTFPVLEGTPAELEKALAKRGVKSQVIEMKVGETRTF